MQLTLPDPKLLQTTGDVDYYQWNYKFPIKYIQRFRFKAILRLMNGRNFENLLEVGTGTGIFLPELSKRCTNLYAIDTHKKMDGVKKMCDASGVTVALSSQSLESTNFINGIFDAVVGISVWEFVDDLEMAVIETKRIMKQGASLFTICPHRNAFLDSAVSLYSRKPANEEFKNSFDSINTLFERHFVVFQKRWFPHGIGEFLHIYCYYELRKL
jgi:ubiquinone/menaquinone biosynthesis C-methylase UbiE